MEMNSAMRLFIRNEIASESAKWIYKAMTVLQAENKNKTINEQI